MPKPYHRNPRQIKKGRFDRLNDTLTRLGDLGGIVHNLRTDEIIGGNQRTAVFGQASEVQIVEQYDTPDEQGTVAHGFVVWQGKKYSYRQVDWNEETAAEANITANVGAGEWDWSVIANEWEPAELLEWGFDESLFRNWKTDAGALGNFLGAEQIDYSQEWQGMPEFEHEDLTDDAAFTIRVFLKDELDLEEFGKLLGKDLAGRKFVWFSKQPIGKTYEAFDEGQV